MRSTARAYEIYLCNVHCRVAAKEVAPVIATNVASADCESGNHATSEKKDKMSLADGNCNSEDDWVEGKVPDSPLHDQKTNVPSRQAAGNSKKDFQVIVVAHHPCITLLCRGNS